jgi:ribosomal RNA-processing protein 9
MSSFFTLPASQKKRKRIDGAPTPERKRRNTASRPQQGRRNQASTNTPAKSKSKADDDDESISGSDSEVGHAANGVEDDEDDSGDDARETAAERRLKLAERYLENIRAEVGEGEEIGFDAADVDRDLIAARLKEDVNEEQGKLYRRLAGDLDYEQAKTTSFRADTLATTGAATCLPYIYTVSKDMTFIKWEIPSIKPTTENNRKKSRRRNKNKNNDTGEFTQPIKVSRILSSKPKQLIYTTGSKKAASNPSYQHHTAPILCVAASTDGRFVVTGGADRKMIVWDPLTLKPLKIFTHHRDAVTSLAFRGKTNQLFSASKDRTIKIWSLDELAYVETLFGHQDEVVDVSAVGGKEERCVSVGARDRSARVWKVVEESQLVFRGGGSGGQKSELDDRIKNKLKMGKKRRDYEQEAEDAAVAPLTNGTASLPVFKEGSLDRVLQLSTSLFVTGSDSGALSLFSLHKKKPLHIISLAHGFDPALSAAMSSAEVDAKESQAQPTARWITALAGIPGCDLFVTGSWDGCVKVWRVSADDRKIESVGVLGEGVAATKITFNDDGDGPLTNGVKQHASPAPSASTTASSSFGAGAVRGIVNDLSVLARGERASEGVIIVAAIGTETRMGRWIQRKGKNGAVMFEVPMLPKAKEVVEEGNKVDVTGI